MSDAPLPELDVGSPSLTAMKAEAQGPIELARRYAALSGPFSPADALRAAGAAQPIDLAISVSSALDAVCDAPAKGQWLLRANERAWDLKGLTDDGRLEEAVQWRRAFGADAATSDLLDALLGQGAFSLDAITRTIDEVEAHDVVRPDLRRLAAALEWSGAFAPASAMLVRIQAALNRADQARRGDLLLADGFHGRDEAVTALTDWISDPNTASMAVRTLYVSGLPAIGKSTLLEHALRQVAARGVDTVVVRLDFDRASLDVLDRLGLSVEVARQVASQAPQIAADLRKARLEAITTQEVQLKGGNRRGGIPYSLIQTLSAYLRSSGRRLVIALDTLEVLRGRGETHPRQLFAWLDQLARAAAIPLVVVAAGRGQALEPVSDRVAKTLTLDRLTAVEAEKLLDDANVPPALRAQVIALAEGDPMQLRLLAVVARQQGEVGLARTDSATVTLYRSLESRLGGRYGKLARVIPLFRRFNGDLLGEVIAPVIGDGRLSPADAGELYAELKEQTWLIAGESYGWLEPHPDLRRHLAAKLYEEQSRRAQELHRRAAHWFAGRSEPWAATESLYHRLQATRWDGPDALKGMNLEAGRAFEPADLEDLPAPARDALLRARGERSYEGRGEAYVAASEISADAVQELRSLIGKGDLAEATYFHDRVFQPASLDPTSEAADAALTLLWRTGRWNEARKLAAERAWTRAWDHALFDTWPEAALVRLEMQAEFHFADLHRWFRQGDPYNLDRVVRLIRMSRINLAFGALAFALGPERLLEDRGNPPAAVLAMWTPDAPHEELRRTLSTAQERRQRVARGDLGYAAPLYSKAEDARTLAILSPYGDLAEWILLRNPGQGRLPSLLDSQLTMLPESVSASLDSTNPAGTLSALGYTAEWLSAVGLLLRDPDLRLIGRSAERWRSAAAGRWRYARPSPGWRGAPTRLDVVIQDRLANLFNTASPFDAARAQLAAWAGGEAGVAQVLRSAKLDRLRSELAPEPREAPHETASRAALQLLRRWIPAAFVPALAILAIEPQRDA